MKQMKFQKIICFATLGVAALCFIFALGITTDLYKTTVVAGCQHIISMSPLQYIKGLDGKEIYYDIQPFNKTLVILSIVMILLAVLQFVVRSHDRRRYYISNYVGTGLLLAGNIGISLYGIINILKYRTRFLTEVDFERWQQYYDFGDTKFKCTQSTFWFDIEIVMLILAIIVALVMVFNLIWKIMLMKYEDKVLKGEVIPEVNE